MGWFQPLIETYLMTQPTLGYHQRNPHIDQRFQIVHRFFFHKDRDFPPPHLKILWICDRVDSRDCDFVVIINSINRQVIRGCIQLFNKDIQSDIKGLPRWLISYLLKEKSRRDTAGFFFIATAWEISSLVFMVRKKILIHDSRHCNGIVLITAKTQFCSAKKKFFLMKNICMWYPGSNHTLSSNVIWDVYSINWQRFRIAPIIAIL